MIESLEIRFQYFQDWYRHTLIDNGLSLLLNALCCILVVSGIKQIWDFESKHQLFLSKETKTDLICIYVTKGLTSSGDSEYVFARVKNLYTNYIRWMMKNPFLKCDFTYNTINITGIKYPQGNICLTTFFKLIYNSSLSRDLNKSKLGLSNIFHFSY